MEFFCFNKAQTGADVEKLCCNNYPVKVVSPTFPNVTTRREATTAEPGEAMKSGSARKMARCADDATMTNTASLYPSPVASSTICATEDRQRLVECVVWSDRKCFKLTAVGERERGGKNRDALRRQRTRGKMNLPVQCVSKSPRPRLQLSKYCLTTFHATNEVVSLDSTAASPLSQARLFHN